MKIYSKIQLLPKIRYVFSIFKTYKTPFKSIMKTTSSFKYLYFILLILNCFAFSTINAQDNRQNNTTDFWQNVRFGGGIGLSFGDNFFSGTLAPSAIYQFNEQFAFGVGLTGTYNEQKDIYKSTVLGGSLIGLFSPINEIQLSVELEELNINQDFNQNFVINSDENFWYTALFLGVGYRAGSVTFGVRYDVLYDRDSSVYADPWIPFVRVYF